jgi:two-component sensor histidine kinase
MLKKLVINIVFLLFASIAVAQQCDTLLLKLSKTGRDTNRVNLLLKLGDNYLFRAGLDKKNIDSALYYVSAGQTLSEAINAVDHRYRALAMKAEISIKKQDFDGADKLFTMVTDHYHSTGEQLKEALAWDRYATLIRFDDTQHLDIRRNGYNKAYEIYKSIHHELRAANALGAMADVDLNLGLYDKAENELLSVIAQYKALRYPKIYYGYYMLAETYYRKNQVQRTLLARLECVNSYENDPHHSLEDGMLYYCDLAAAYGRNKVYANALVYYQKAVALAVKLRQKTIYYFSVTGIVDSYASLKKYKLGLAELRKLADRYKSKTPEEERVILAAQMKLYNLLGNIKDGEKIIPAFKKVNSKLSQDIEKASNFYAVNEFIKNSDPLLQHYILSQQWKNFAKELQALEALPAKKTTVVFKLLLYKDRFKLDSATGNTLAALKKFQQIKLIEDSITNLANSKQIEEMEAKYESVKKDKTIQNLNNQSTIQKSKLDKSNLQRNITIAGILVTIIIAVLLYVAYRNKQRSNFKLQAKQEQINRQNEELSTLVKEEEKLLKDKDALLNRQQGLITEKEWLLREVHHRVKNNLQMVMSLLYTQSAYLQNTDAIDAIRDSQNRVQAISIIHQKLYSKSNVTTVVMSDYVNDLVRHLCSVFDCASRKINIKQVLEAINLDISQGVPMGLILNEAITNSIKYAFSKDGGEIIIRGQLIEPETINLIIADNGKGLPVDFNLAQSSSLGMEMMRALSKQLGGTFEIKNDPGVIITIIFKIENTFKPVAEKLAAL